ncbi:glycosyltransferase family 2 protein [Bacillus sp. mrc49]|uniref:glycosyltransferase family 2 protein n=1 Tax=Bacillus sp. mrc49 TaxID=2054913 RepID=UPI000C27F067|nr:glycosyltransferase family 2 protein [Bacillus sp. mrc49]PJN89262.1 glycosyltransferase family 2 protein [Bacillus sp. mrc49]
MFSLSVILPIYNVEAYLADCLDSIIKSIEKANCKKRIEVILVNDGSTDQSITIAKLYSSKYNFVYLEKKNGGLSDARNHGLQFANGDFVGFIDSDDKVSEDYFSSILKAIEDNPDLIIFNWYDFFNDAPMADKIVRGMDDENFLWTIQPSAWNKIYKKRLFNEIKFPKGKIYEDVGTMYKILSKVNEFIFLEQPLYMYRKGRQNSLLNTINPKINHIYDVLEDTYKFYFPEINKNQLAQEGLCYQYVKLLMWSNMYRQIKYYKLNIWGFYKKMNETRTLINNRFPNWKNNKLIDVNSFFFKERFGSNYIEKIDRIGKNFPSTVLLLFIIIFKNIKRK